MKYAVILTSIVILLNSCVKINPFGINKPCSGSCVTISGRFTTTDNQPIPNASIAIRSERSRGAYDLDIRLIAQVKTDANGYYSVSFALKDYEWGPQASASIHFKYDYDERQYLSIFNHYKDIKLSSRGNAFTSNDLMLTKNFYFPKIARVNLQLTGFTPPLNYDDNYFMVNAICKAGEDAQEKAVGGVVAEATVNTKEILVAGGDSTRLYIEKRKNGVMTKKDTTVYLPVGTRKDIGFHF